MSDAALELEGISKAFGACVASRRASLRVRAGSVHAVLGENGAGKSTLLTIAYGALRADSGTIRLRGKSMDVASHSPSASVAEGVGMVFQHFMLVGPLSILENVVLGREPVRGLSLDLARARKEITPLLERMHVRAAPETPIEELSVGEQQRVEIVKVLWRGAEVLLLDEPTAVLSPPEVKQLFQVLDGLKREGKTIVIVTHKLDEVEAIADRITVMRKGEVVAEFERGAERAAIVRAIVGRDVDERRVVAPREPGPTVLEVDDLVAPRVDKVSFSVREGEILGIAGVLGNGQTELVEILAGLRKPTSGRVRLNGVDLLAKSVRARFAAGLGHVAEDRHLHGMILDFTLAENLVLGRQWEFARPAGMDRDAIELFAAKRLSSLGVVPPDADALGRSLSGGNQQKVVMARELGRPGLRALLCAQPTRGVDLGAAERIHDEIIRVRDAGGAVLLLSSELHELRQLSTRIAVMHRGRLVAVMPVAEATDELLGALMTGVHA